MSEYTVMQLIVTDISFRSFFLIWWFNLWILRFWSWHKERTLTLSRTFYFSFCLQRVPRKELNTTYPGNWFCTLKVKTEKEGKNLKQPQYELLTWHTSECVLRTLYDPFDYFKDCLREHFQNLLFTVFTSSDIFCYWNVRYRFINDNNSSVLKKSFVLLPNTVRTSTCNMKYFGHQIFIYTT